LTAGNNHCCKHDGNITMVLCSSEINEFRLTAVRLQLYNAPTLICPALLRCAALWPQAPTVRMTAADNLGELTRLSARVEQLVADLAGSAASAADPDTAAAYLTALRGALRASGDRLTPPTLDKVQAQLLSLYKTMASRPGSSSSADDNAAAAALVTACGQYCLCAGSSGTSAVLSAGPLGAGGVSGRKEERELAAMLLAAVARSAGEGLEGAGLLRPAVEAAVKATRDGELVSWGGGRFPPCVG